MEKRSFTSMGKKTAHLMSRNILSTAAVIALMGAAAFAAAPAGGYLPGATLNPDCAPSDTDCIVQGGDMTDDSWTMSGANVVVENGNVGIGTDNPESKLDVNGVIRTQGYNYQLKTQDGWGGWARNYEFLSNTGSRLVGFGAFGSNPGSYNYSYIGKSHNDNSIVFDNEGEIGIGLINPTVSLEIAKDDGEHSSLILGKRNTARGMRIEKDSLAAPYNLDFYWSDHGTSEAGNLNFHGSQDSGALVTFKNDGNVGIGTANPSADLHIASNSSYLWLQDTDAINGTGGLTAALKLRDSSGAGAGLIGFDSSSNQTMRMYNYTGSPIAIGSSPSFNTVNILGNGNVGIGDTNPSHKLTVEDNDDGLKYVIRAENNSSGTGAVTGLWLQSNGNNAVIKSYSDNHASKPELVEFGTVAGQTDVSLIAGGESRVLIQDNGNVGIGTTTPSDKLTLSGGTLTVQNSTTSGSPDMGLIGKIKIQHENGYNSIAGYERGLSLSSTPQAEFDSHIFIAGDLVPAYEGNVSIGNTWAYEKLHVDGAAILGNTTNVCNGLNAGAIKFNAGQFQGCTGTAWVNLH